MSESSLEGHLHRLCGGRYTRAAEAVTLRISGMAATVERGLYRCAKCGDEQRTVEQREAAEQGAVAAMRAEHGLLLPKAIRQLRESLGLTQLQLGELLYGTPKGIVDGWEKGRYLQNRETDARLRALQDLETLERVAARSGVTLPPRDEHGNLIPQAPPAGFGLKGAAAAPAASQPGDTTAAVSPSERQPA